MILGRVYGNRRVKIINDKILEFRNMCTRTTITALIVNDFFGGKIMKCMASSGNYYYNIIDDELVDLTVEQFLG